MDKGKLKRFAGEAHSGSDRTAPYPVSRMAPATELVDMAREIAEADKQLGNVTHAKLKVIADQMQALQQQARRVLERAQHDQLLHRARCNFSRQPGKRYHLYQKGSGERYFSMLSPQEWGEAPHDYLGSYRLENDMSWTAVEEIGADESSEALLEQLLGNEHEESHDGQ